MSVETQAKGDGQEAYDKAICDQKTENLCIISEGLILEPSGFSEAGVNSTVDLK